MKARFCSIIIMSDDDKEVKPPVKPADEPLPAEPVEKETPEEADNVIVPLLVELD